MHYEKKMINLTLLKLINVLPDKNMMARMKDQSTELEKILTHIAKRGQLLKVF